MNSCTLFYIRDSGAVGLESKDIVGYCGGDLYSLGLELCGLYIIITLSSLQRYPLLFVIAVVDFATWYKRLTASLLRIVTWLIYDQTAQTDNSTANPLIQYYIKYSWQC